MQAQKSALQMVEDPSEGWLSPWLPRHLAAWLLPGTALLSLWPAVQAGQALLLGAALALLLGNPHLHLSRVISRRLLPSAVVGLGAGMDLQAVARAGLSGLGYTLASIALVLALGAALARLLGVKGACGTLVNVGTAICGGSAIAAVGPIVRAKPAEMTVALTTVFLLNALALAIFPSLGHAFDLTEAQFGLWSALAIHDTSSVVGAGLLYGPQALAIGTTVKLARALWIVPMALLFSAWQWHRQRQAHSDAATPLANTSRPPLPWFIVGFLATAAAVTYIPALQPLGAQVNTLARRLLVLTLFLIGANLSLPALRQVGVRPFLHGFLLWILVSGVTLAAIMRGVIG